MLVNYVPWFCCKSNSLITQATVTWFLNSFTRVYGFNTTHNTRGMLSRPVSYLHLQHTSNTYCVPTFARTGKTVTNTSLQKGGERLCCSFQGDDNKPIEASFPCHTRQMNGEQADHRPGSQCWPGRCWKEQKSFGVDTTNPQLTLQARKMLLTRAGKFAFRNQVKKQWEIRH